MKENLRDKLPLAMPKPCPICGKAVYLMAVTEWGADDGEISGTEFGCETEPDIDSDEWWDWHNGHYRMPYVDWLPWETRAVAWLNERYRYEG